MYSYIKGIIKDIELNYIVLESNNIGYQIFVGNPYSFNIDQICTIYIYSHIREDANTLYGFKSKEAKKMFLKLINVKGLGPKLGILMVSNNISELISAIDNDNVSYLKKFPKIGDKLARQIILDLKGKLTTSENVLIQNKSSDELSLVLEGLGYKSGDINKVIKQIDISKTLEDQIKEALKLMLK
ncbi:MAG: Holliday junction branch migration protein RuvA [Bacilli bacterium]